METKDIIALAKAGFSREEIAKISTIGGNNVENSPKPAEEEKQNTELEELRKQQKELAEKIAELEKPADPKPADKANTDPNTVVYNNMDELAELLNKQFEGVKKAIQGNNIVTSGQPDKEGTPDILAKIISPYGEVE